MAIILVYRRVLQSFQGWTYEYCRDCATLLITMRPQRSKEVATPGTVHMPNYKPDDVEPDIDQTITLTVNEH